VLSLGSGDCGTPAGGTKLCEPPVNTPFPAYYGLQFAGRLAQPGARLVATTGTGAAGVVAHAAVRPDGTLVLLLENQDAAHAHTVALRYPGYRVAPSGTAYSYGSGSTPVTTGPGGSAQQTLPPYGMTELVLRHC
jgi:hypothetical protein